MLHKLHKLKHQHSAFPHRDTTIIQMKRPLHWFHILQDDLCSLCGAKKIHMQAMLPIAKYNIYAEDISVVY
jgi:hypothetical protein